MSGQVGAVGAELDGGDHDRVDDVGDGVEIIDVVEVMSATEVVDAGVVVPAPFVRRRRATSTNTVAITNSAAVDLRIPTG